MNILPRVLDRCIAAPLSILTGLAITIVVAVNSVGLVPSILFSKYIMKWPSMYNLPPPPPATASEGGGGDTTNTSNTSVGSITAIKTLCSRSQMFLMCNGGEDNIAPLIMGGLSLSGPNIPGSRWATQLYNLLTRWNFYLTGRILPEQFTEAVASNIVKFGVNGLVHTRTCFLDDVVDTFSEEHKGKEFNVVILGAGYDTRLYRLDSIMKKKNVNLYEVDAAGSQENKKKSLMEANVGTEHVRFVPCDFETKDWLETLRTKSDFDTKLPSVFVWEGVCYYLDRDVVVSTISKIAALGKGSCIAFDYFDESSLNQPLRKSSKKIGEPLKFGIEDVQKLVKECNEQSSVVHPLKVMDHLRCEELKRRYVSEFNGRHTVYLSEFGGCLLLGSK